MKKIISFVLTACLMLGLFMGTASASTANTSSAQQVVSALGIIVGDGSGNLNLDSNVTRAQFAKMMIAASTYKDTISATSNSSPFKDVSYTNWAASYIQTAVTATWMTGYTDGTFRPDNNVTLKEAVSAVLKMLGYTSSDFSGAFPEAQIAKYAALGLNTNISKTQDQTLSRQDCVNLFYNLMNTKNKSGSYYATGLGYTVSTAGQIDYSSLVLANMKGPFVVEDSSWRSALPFAASSATVYLNGSASTLSAISNYDVYYYNTGMKTIWAYSNTVSGVYTAATPSTAAPTKVTVAGTTYSITTSDAAYALSSMGTYNIGSTVTLLLGMDGDVVAVMPTDASFSSTKYGFVTALSSLSYTDSTGTANAADAVTVFCTDGTSGKYECGNSGVAVGDMVKVSFSGGKTSISGLTKASFSGTVDSTGVTVGSYAFASNVEIMDAADGGSYIRVYPSRLAGMELTANDILYFDLDSSGKLSHLILNDVTGDAYSYGIITSAVNANGSMSNSCSYKYIMSGTTTSYSSNSKTLNATIGPALFEFSGTSIVKIQNLSSANLSSLSSASAMSNGTQYLLSESVQTYIYKSGSYTLSNVSSVSSLSNYSLVGYYDKLPSQGGRIRVIIATAN